MWLRMIVNLVIMCGRVLIRCMDDVLEEFYEEKMFFMCWEIKG